MRREAGNFGLFIGNYEQMRKIALRVREAALELGVKRIVVGECGHAWRVAYSFWNTLIGPFDFLDPRYPVPQHICEFTYDLIQRGALKFDKEKNDDRIVTFHDSCNVARASRMGDMPGGQFVIPREIIKAVANHFHDMAPETIHEATFCCGGGGGLLTDDLLELRVKGALPRMEALKHVVDEHGVNFMATICAICKAQFTQGAAVLRLRHEHGRRRAPAGQQGHPARRQAANSTARRTHRGDQTCPPPPNSASAKPLTFRRYKDGDDKPLRLAGADLRRRPLAQVPDLHPEHAALPGQLPVGRGHPRLPEHRARHREAARRHAVAGIRLAPPDRGQPVPVGDGPRLPGAVRVRLQPQRGRRFRRHQLGRALPRRLRDREQAGLPEARHVAPARRWP